MYLIEDVDGPFARIQYRGAVQLDISTPKYDIDEFEAISNEGTASFEDGREREWEPITIRGNRGLSRETGAQATQLKGGSENEFTMRRR